MYIKKITYTDYNGDERTETACFNVTEAELAEMNLSVDGGYQDHLRRIVEAHDIPSIVAEFKKLIKLSYGMKSPDGRKFVKNPDATEDFLQTEGYSQFFMELITNEDSMKEFVLGIIPEKYRGQILEANKELPANA